MDEFTRKMSLLRPGSGKRKQKYQFFSSDVSCTRLRKVQGLLKQGDGSTPSSIDGLLCVLGIDSRYNTGTKTLLNYLMFGYCDILADNLNRSKLTDEVLEDVVVFVKPECVHVYCNPLNYPVLLPYVAHWRNLHIHCLDTDKYEGDDERAEEFKIISFVTMVTGCSTIGIAYGTGEGSSMGKKHGSFEPFAVEKWPLVQAFALEGLGGGGFFTMKHEVVDITQDLDDIYGTLDPVSAEILFTENLPLLERHCYEVLTNVDVKSQDSLDQLDEGSVAEPLLSYFTHGHISDSQESRSLSVKQTPFVLFGTNSCRSSLDKLKEAHHIKRNCSKAQTGVAGKPATHMVCFAVEPKGAISCARTWFFENGFVPFPANVQQGSCPAGINLDTRLLINLYLVAVDAVLQAIQTYSATFSFTQAHTSLVSTMKSGFLKRKININSSFISSNVKFTIENRDVMGRNVSQKPDVSYPHVKTASLYLYDVPSLEHEGKLIGSIVFAESFIDSAIKTVLPDGKHSWNTRHLVLTRNVPRHVTWMGSEFERSCSDQWMERLKSNEEDATYGKRLVSGETVLVGGVTPCSKWEEGNLYVFEKGLVISHPRCGVLAVPRSELTSLQFYDGDSMSVVACLILTYSPTLTQHLPCHLDSEENCIMIGLPPKTKVHREFYNEVLPLWKGEKQGASPALEVIQDLPNHLCPLHASLQRELKESNLQVTGPRHAAYSVDTATNLLPGLSEYLRHFKVSSSTGKKPVPAAHLPVLLGNSASEEVQADAVITVLTGVPGSGKEALCSSLFNLVKENNRWILLKRPVDKCESFDAKGLQNLLKDALIKQRRNPRIGGGRKKRVFIVTSGFTDVVDVIQALSCHPDPGVSSSIRVGAVTCCVDPQNVFMENNYVLPKLLEQCAQGFVNNVVFTSCLEPQNEQLSRVQKLIRACNPDVAFVLAKGGQVTRTPDVELILAENAFTDESTLRRRHVMCPGWYFGQFTSGSPEQPVNEMLITFYRPLQKQRLISKLREMQGRLDVRKTLEEGGIHSLQGQLLFSEGDTIVNIKWTRLSGGLMVAPVDTTAIPRPPSRDGRPEKSDGIDEYFIVFTGFSLKEASLRQWLRSCCKPKPEKKTIKGKKELTKKEISDINVKHKCDPLPPGWFYNGVQYVSFSGDKSFDHPLLDQFVEQYLKEVNESITKHNAVVDCIPDTDLFTKPSVK